MIDIFKIQFEGLIKSFNVNNNKTKNKYIYFYNGRKTEFAQHMRVSQMDESSE